MTELVRLIREGASVDAIGDYLNALPSMRREEEVTTLRRGEQAELFDIAADAAPIRLGHFVPEAAPPLRPVHHAGRNTIATLAHFQRFQKRFARPTEGADRLIGYNASNAWFIKPGYFVAYETDGRDEWERRGGVVVDYHQIPGGDVPRGWPDVVPNSQGLQRLVYLNTRDFMRRVSTHVSIGRASREDAKGDLLLDYWFTLCRRERDSSTENE
ncbi:MAG: hypothetical protein EVA89_13970 [Sandaracinaceae bacterium]|nr:MAG: hypothetical protein EVA89_13970 [Sandaracinaceae bacterium]